MLTRSLSDAADKRHLQDEEIRRAERELQQRAQEHKQKEVKEIKENLAAPLIGGLFNANIAAAKKMGLANAEAEILQLKNKLEELSQDQAKITEQMNDIHDKIVQKQALFPELTAVMDALNLSITQTETLREELRLKEITRDYLRIECDEFTTIDSQPKRKLFGKY